MSKLTHARTRGIVAVAAVGALAVGALAGCSTAPDGDGASQEQTLKYGLSAEPTEIRTGVDQGSAAKEITALVRRGLLQYDAEGEPVPALAEDWDVSEDGLTYTFALREGLTFSNGDPLTSKDVKRTFEYLANEDNGAAYQSVFALATIETPDDTTVILNLERPYTALPKVIADPLSTIVPEEPLDDNGAPVGSGPFAITDYQKGVSYTLEANEEFYNADAVNFDSIEITFMPDAQARISALTTGQVDFIDYVPASDYATLDDADGIVLDHAPGLFGALELNLTDGPLADPLVRQAIAYGIDTEAIEQVGTLGYGTATRGLPISEDSPYFDEEQANRYSHDPKKAQALLEKAGYGDGFSLDLVTTSQYFGFTERAQVVQSNLAEIGITVNLVSGDYANLIALGNSGEYDMLQAGPPTSMNDVSALTAAFLGGPTFVRPFGVDQDLYADLLHKGEQLPDGDERAKVYHEIGEIYLEDMPFITTGQGAVAFAYSDDLEGFEMLSGALAYSSPYSFETARLAG